MANWCSNVLRVYGSDEDIKTFDRKFKGFPARTADAVGEERPKIRKYCFNALYPLPKNQRENWYDWRIEHWSVKWDVWGDVQKVDTATDKELEYFFATPWCPPENWLQHVSSNFPRLTFEITYWEFNCNFAGRTRYQDGIVTDEQNRTNDDARDLLEAVGYVEEWEDLQECIKEAENEIPS